MSGSEEHPNVADRRGASPGFCGPTFVGIGVQKAATSWLHDVFGEHPDVYVSEPKEIDFFSRFYDRGYEWYERHFEAGRDAKARGEFSPSYFYDPAAPERLRRYAPDIRLVAILRDPVERAFSNHLHEIRKGHLTSTLSFETALPRNPAYIEQGLYATHLQRWIDAFGREALLVLLAEEIAADPAAAVAAACAHLGVGPVPPGARALGERRHESVGVRSEVVRRVLRGGGDMLRALGLGDALAAAKRGAPVRALLAMNERPLRAEVPPMRPDTRAALEELFRPELERLAEMIGRRDLPWRSWTAARDSRAVA